MKPKLLFIGALVTAVTFSTTSSFALDWPHWLGPQGNNMTTDPGFKPDLSEYTTAWEKKIGHGYSSVTVANGRAYGLGHDGKAGETVYCFDAATGEELWKFPYPAELLPRMHPGGPNASATVVGDRVLTLSKDGQLFCLSADKGEKQWEITLPKAMGIEVPNWGFGSSPVVVGEQVLVSAGKVIALELATGKQVWLSNAEHPAAYATPVPFESGGKKLIAAMDGEGLAVVNANDGTEVAHHPFKAQFDLLAPTPTVLDGGAKIFISANASSELVTFDGKSLNSVWATKELKNSLNNSVVVNGVIYGIDGPQGKSTCRLVAMNLADGKILWTKDNFGYGTTIGVDDSLLALTENGELIAAKISPTGYQELGRQQVLGKTCWTTPTVANGRIYVRNDQGTLLCLSAN